MGSEWRKSSYSSQSGGACVEITSDAQAVKVRDTTNRGGFTLNVSASAWSEFTGTIKLPTG
jgi:hypothetical protein